MKHMTLEEWDRRVAPFLATIGIRSKHVKNDAKQILDWVNLLPAAPDFDTEAFSKLREAATELEAALNAIYIAINNYAKKEKVK